MKLEIGKIAETREWSNKNFNARHLLVGSFGNEYPSEVKIYFADKPLILQKEMFSGMPFLTYKQDPKASPGNFKLIPGIAVDRRYTFYLVKTDRPEAVESLELQFTS